MALLCLMFMVCALRTNVLFVVIFLLLSTALQLLAGAYWKMADDLVGNAEIANTLTVVSNYYRSLATSKCGSPLTIV